MRVSLMSLFALLLCTFDTAHCNQFGGREISVSKEGVGRWIQQQEQQQEQEQLQPHSPSQHFDIPITHSAPNSPSFSSPHSQLSTSSTPLLSPSALSRSSTHSSPVHSPLHTAVAADQRRMEAEQEGKAVAMVPINSQPNSPRTHQTASQPTQHATQLSSSQPTQPTPQPSSQQPSQIESSVPPINRLPVHLLHDHSVTLGQLQQLIEIEHSTWPSTERLQALTQRSLQERVLRKADKMPLGSVKDYKSTVATTPSLRLDQLQRELIERIYRHQQEEQQLRAAFEVENRQHQHHLQQQSEKLSQFYVFGCEVDQSGVWELVYTYHNHHSQPMFNMAFRGDNRDGQHVVPFQTFPLSALNRDGEVKISGQVDPAQEFHYNLWVRAWNDRGIKYDLYEFHDFCKFSNKAKLYFEQQAKKEEERKRKYQAVRNGFNSFFNKLSSKQSSPQEQESPSNSSQHKSNSNAPQHKVVSAKIVPLLESIPESPREQAKQS